MPRQGLPRALVRRARPRRDSSAEDQALESCAALHRWRQFWVTDFGLAKAEDDGLTQTGDVLGTIRYMAGVSPAKPTLASDVYALGLTLYELLILRPAFDSPNRLALVEHVKNVDPPRPRSIDPRIPLDLETIVLKAIEKDARRGTPADLMNTKACARFLADEPILARQVMAWPSDTGERRKHVR